VAGSCEHSDEHSDPINVRKFLDQLSECHILKRGSSERYYLEFKKKLIWIHSVSIVTRLRAEPNDQGSIPDRCREFFSVRHRVQSGCGAHLPPYPTNTGVSFPAWEGEEAGA
jgi:hypothetical protein